MRERLRIDSAGDRWAAPLLGRVRSACEEPQHQRLLFLARPREPTETLRVGLQDCESTCRSETICVRRVGFQGRGRGYEALSLLEQAVGFLHVCVSK
jgi:hypothetical protein